MTATTHAMLGPRHIQAFRQRQENLRAALESADLTALLVSHPTDIEYLTGFIGDDSLLLILPAKSVVITDARYDEFLDPWRKSAVTEVEMGTRHRLHETVKRLCQAGKISTLGVQTERLTVAQHDAFSTTLAPLHLALTTGLIGALRMRKDAVEIEAIEKALSIHQAAIDAALERLSIGMTELQLSAVLDYEMKWRGAFKPSFDAIIGSGPNSSIIHYMTGEARIREGVLLVDCGAKVNGYCSDLTRTFGLGGFPPKIREIYNVVLEAQQAAIDAIAPGKICADVDAVARTVIAKAGYGEYFGHGLGHGLGKDVHEAPYFNNLQTDVALEPGMVMTVEPGIYLPGVGGVRIEDDVLITDNGSRVLSNYPKGLDSCVIEPGVTTGA